MLGRRFDSAWVHKKHMKQSLVIIPGWGGTRESWQKFIDLAQVDFDVRFIDMPCFGETPCPETVWGVEDYAEFVKSKIGDLDRPFLLGHSFGGQVAANLAANNSEMFSKLILSGAAILRPKYTTKRMIFNAIAKTGKLIFSLPLLNRVEPLAKKILYKAADSPDYDKTSGIKREIFKKIIRQSQIEALPKINTPTMVVWGTHDTYVPLSEGRKIARLISGAELEVVQGGKHGLHIQQPENFLEIVKKFLSK